jgi:ferrous iron transport protein A
MFSQSFTVELCTLNLLNSRETAIIRRVKETDSKILEKLQQMGIVPGMPITLERRFPYWVVKIGKTRFSINHQIASHIYVKKEK